MFFLARSVFAGFLFGLGWRIDSFALLGIVGMGLFLHEQLRQSRFLACAVNAILVGYIGFLTANGWMQWTVDSVVELSDFKSTLVVHGIHLLHGGSMLLFAMVWWFFRRISIYGWLLGPAIWLAQEAIYPGMYPMRQGCLLLQIQPLTQIAAIVGVAGVTLQAFLLASLIPLSFRYLGFDLPSQCADKSKESACPSSMLVPTAKASKFAGFAVLFLTAINFGWGSIRINQIDQAIAADPSKNDTLSLTVLQGPTEYATYHRDILKRSREHAEGSDLIIWPECSIGQYHQSLNCFDNELQVLLNSVGVDDRFQPWPKPECHLLAGGYSWTGDAAKRQVDQKYVSAYLFDKTETVVGRHDKVELMPGGEFIPGEAWFPWLTDWLGETDESEEEFGAGYQVRVDPSTIPLSRGSVAKPIGSVGGVSIGAMLCCEDMHPSVARQLTNQGADLFVCLANGMSFHSEVGLRQHFNIGRFRAIENNRYFVRCGSTGVTCLVSPTGQIVKSLPCLTEGTLHLEIPTAKREDTIYSSLGDALSISAGTLLAGFAIILGVCHLLPGSRSKQSQIASKSGLELKTVADQTRC